MNVIRRTMESDSGQIPEEEEDSEQDQLWERIESKRHVLTKSINPVKLTDYLRQCKVIDEEDEDEVLRSHLLTTRRARASRLLDILRSRGNRGYEAFLESLELYYAELYKLITGKEPTRCCSLLVVEEGYEGLTQFLMNEAVKLQKQLKDRDMEIHRLHGKCEALQEGNKQLCQQHQELRGYQERYSKLKEEFELYNNELNKVKEENYLLALRYTQLNEEKSVAVTRTRELQLEESMNSRLNLIDCHWYNTDQEEDTFPKFCRQRRTMRMESSSTQSRECADSEYAEELSPMELLWSDIEYKREMNRFSMIPFPPDKQSLIRRIKMEEPDNRFDFWPISSSTDNEDSSPDEAQPFSLSFAPGPCGPSLSPESEDASDVPVGPTEGSNKQRTISSSVSLPDLTSINNTTEHDQNDIIATKDNGPRIFVKSVQEEPEAENVRLQDGCQLLMMDVGVSQRISLQNYRAKGACWMLHSCPQPDPLQLQKNAEDCRKLERVLEGEEDERMARGSFYIRVNLNILGQVDSCSLQVKCDEILHVLDMAHHTNYEWLCARVNPFTMEDVEQGTIPSYNRAYQLLLVKIYALTGNFWKNERAKKNDVKMKKLCPDQVRIVPASLPTRVPNASSPSLKSWHEDKDEKILPYSLVQPITVQQKRPVIIMPTLLARALMHRLLQSPSASEFNIVQPEIVTDEQLRTKTRFSLQKIRNQDKYECITLKTIKDVVAKDKHGLLPIGVHSVKDLIAEKIYAIIIHIKVTTKNIKKLRKLAPKSCSSDAEFLKVHRIEQKHLESVPCLSATVEANTWGNIEELLRVVKDSIVQEQRKIVWVEQDKLSLDSERSPADLHSQPNI
ncbi:caspase recruitment domain-containing protein 11-like [Scyliorhinus torazame]|uniref:caspase recruitment domain-containing protein 11-like n=1 Tax=Scyliorhinus torazame TaxID=75743 RepID=UPI003B5CFDDD